MLRLLNEAHISTDGQRGIHILGRLAQDGLICFGPREGKQQTFVLLEEWVPESKDLERDEALANMAKRYFKGHGPATVQDFVWWSGLKVADAKAGVEMGRAGLAQETVAGEVYYFGQDMPELDDR
jgi:Winged helix DNA-binding domain